MVTLESLQYLRAYADVNDMRGIYAFVDGIIQDVLFADFDTTLALYRDAERLSCSVYDVYLSKHLDYSSLLSFHAQTALRSLIMCDFGSKYHEVNLTVLQMIKSISLLL